MCRSIVLLATTTLSVYKAWGHPVVRIAKAKRGNGGVATGLDSTLAPWRRYVVFGIIAVALLFSSCTMPVFKYA